jgi:hypothetical protein
VDLFTVLGPSGLDLLWYILMLIVLLGKFMQIKIIKHLEVVSTSCNFKF